MMKHRVRWAAALIVIGLAGCQADRVATDTTSNLPPAQTTVAAGADIRQLYQDKTWLWADGAGYFAPSGTFTAWMESGDKTTYAKGFWWVNDQGGMCFDAVWHVKDSANSAVTCFGHRTAGNVWYQKKDPAGAWYVFKSDPVKPDDEFQKLKAGDVVEAQLQAARTELGITTP